MSVECREQPGHVLLNICVYLFVDTVIDNTFKTQSMVKNQHELCKLYKFVNCARILTGLKVF